MHVMTKYIDTRKAATAALCDYPTMEALSHHGATDTQAAQIRADMTTIRSQPLDGMPHARDPHATENRIAAGIDKLDTLAQRQHQAREYLDWFLPARALLSDDDQYVLETLYLGEGSQDERVALLEDHYYIERDSVYRKKNRAIDHLAIALYGYR